MDATNGTMAPTEETIMPIATSVATVDDNSKKRKLESADDSVSAAVTAEAFKSLDESQRLACLEKWLAPTSDQDLRKLLLQIAVNNPTAYQSIHAAASEDPVHRKLFVRGLSWNTTDEMLRVAFAPYGDVQEAVAVQDKATGRNKGFGFVTYKSMDGAYTALDQPQKEIDGRTVECNLAALRAPGSKPGGSSMGGGGGGGMHMGGGMGSVSASGEPESMRKLFVKGLSYDTSTEALRAFFSVFGDIEFCQVITHRDTGRSRGYGFVTFSRTQSAQAALMQPEKTIDGRQTVCNLAEVGKQVQAAQQMGGMGGYQQQGMGGGMQAYGGGGGGGMGGGMQGYGNQYNRTGSAQVGGQQGGQQGFQNQWMGQQATQQAGTGQVGAQQAYNAGGQMGMQGTGTAAVAGMGTQVPATQQGWGM